MPENSIMSRISALLEKLEVGLMAIASMALSLIMVIVFVDVFMRYVFSAPLGWSYDTIALYLIVAVFFLALPDTLHHHGHIAIDLFQPLIPRRPRHVGEAVGYLMATAIVALITVQAYDRLVVAYMAGDRMAGLVAWPTWISYLIVVVGCATLGLRCAYRCVGHMATAITGRAMVEIAPPPIAEIPNPESL